MHAFKHEKPVLYNLLYKKFFHKVESGQYRLRDARAVPERML